MIDDFNYKDAPNKRYMDGQCNHCNLVKKIFIGFPILEGHFYKFKKLCKECQKALSGMSI